MSSKTDTINKEEVSITNVSSDKNWQSWNLPLVPQNKIYKKTTFSNISFLSNYTIKTVEKTYSLKQSFETIQLLGRDEIDKNIKKLFIYTFWFSSSCGQTFNKTRIKYKCSFMFKRW